jgi:hypothetical protein
MSRKIITNKKTWYILLGVFIVCIAIAMYIISNFFVGWFKKPKLEQNINSTHLYGNTVLADMESEEYLVTGSTTFTNQYALSGSFSSLMPGSDTYSATILLNILETDSVKMSNANIECWILPSSELINAVLVFSIVDSTEANTLHWDGYKIEGNNFTPNTWNRFAHNFNIPAKYLDKNNCFKIYVWNIDENNQALYVDDIKIKFNQESGESKPRTLLLDYEDISDVSISDKRAKTGKYSAVASGKDSYTLSYYKELSYFDLKNFDRLHYRYWYYSESPNIDFVLVFIIVDEKGEVKLWHGSHLNPNNAEPLQWLKMQGMTEIPEDIVKPGNKLQIYGWNRNNNTVYFDDVYIILKSSGDIKTGDKAFCDLVNNETFQPRINYPPYPFFNFTFTNDCTKSFESIPTNNWSSKYFVSGNFINNQYDEILYFPPNNKLQLFSFNNSSFNSFSSNFISNSHQLFIPVETTNETNLLMVIDNSKETITFFEPSVSNNALNLTLKSSFTYQQLNITSPVNNALSIRPTKNNIYDLIINTQNQLLKFELDFETILAREVIENFDTPNDIKLFAGNFSGQGNQELALIGTLNKSYRVILYDIINNQNVKPINKNTNCNQGFDTLAYADNYFSGIYTSDSVTSLLKLVRNWRFDLKMLEINSIGYQIKSQISFSGYPKNYDPRFFSQTFFISANLTGDYRNELLIFVSNENKNASNRLSNNNISWLPNKIALYATE